MTRKRDLSPGFRRLSPDAAGPSQDRTTPIHSRTEKSLCQSSLAPSRLSRSQPRPRPPRRVPPLTCAAPGRVRASQSCSAAATRITRLLGERAGAALDCLYADDRQAGWAPLLRNFFIAARRLESRRRHVARRHDLPGRRRGLLKWDHAGARPHRALLSQARTGRAHCLLRGINETAVGKRPPLHHILA
jgi:hypothetical protein